MDKHTYTSSLISSTCAHHRQQTQRKEGAAVWSDGGSRACASKPASNLILHYAVLCACSHACVYACVWHLATPRVATSVLPATEIPLRRRVDEIHPLIVRVRACVYQKLSANKTPYSMTVVVAAVTMAAARRSASRTLAQSSASARSTNTYTRTRAHAPIPTRSLSSISLSLFLSAAARRISVGAVSPAVRTVYRRH